jgi:outer membrane lipase/esterase
MKHHGLARLFAASTLAVAALAAPLQAWAYSELVIFGDSLSDTGNIGAALGPASWEGPPPAGDHVPSAPYAPYGVSSHGPVWASSFASQLGLGAVPSLPGGTNFALGGARTGTDGAGPCGLPWSLVTQLGSFLSATGGVADGNALCVVAGGGNNLRDAAVALSDPSLSFAEQIAIFTNNASTYATDIGGIVDRLHDEAGVTRFDQFGALHQITADPAAHGIVNVIEA